MNPQSHLNETYAGEQEQDAKDSLENFHDEFFQGAKAPKAPEKQASLTGETKGAWTVSTDTNTNLTTIVLKKADGSKIEIEDLKGKAKIRIQAPSLKDELVMTDLEGYGYSPDGTFFAKRADGQHVHNNPDGSITKKTASNEIKTYQADGRIVDQTSYIFTQGDKRTDIEWKSKVKMEKFGKWLTYTDKEKQSKTSVLEQNDGTRIKIEELGDIKTTSIHAPFLKEDLVLNDHAMSDLNSSGAFSTLRKNDSSHFSRRADGELTLKTNYGLSKVWKTDGTSTTHRPYATVITENADGSIKSELFTGHKITKKVDGSYVIEMPDHQIVNWTAKNNGITKEANSPETMNLPDGLKISHLTDGTDVYQWPDGRKVTEFADGRLQRVTPYSVLIGDKGNDKSRRALPSGNTGYLIEQDGLKSEDNILQDSEEAKIVARKLEKELENTFGVTFSKPTDPPHVTEEFNGDKKTRPCREATLQELLVIKEALYKSQPNNFYNGHGIRFEFLDGERFDGTQAFYREGIIHIPTRYISDKIDWFQNDQIAYNGRLGTDSFEAYVMHELAHNKSQRISALKGNDYYSESQLASFFGLKPITNQFGQKIWVVLVKNKTKDEFNPDGLNHMYMIEKLANGKRVAIRCNEQAFPIGSEGNVNREELRKRALVNSSTFDLGSPEEIIAEALVCLRIGGKTRAEAMKNSPQAMAIALELDQDEIDNAYPANQTYPYGLTRSSDGYLVAKMPPTQLVLENKACQTNNQIPSNRLFRSIRRPKR